MGSLSSAQIEHYSEHGYVILQGGQGVLGPDEIARYLQRATEIANGDVPEAAANRLVKDIQFAKGILPMPDDPEHALWKILNPDRFDPVMAECLRLPRVLDAVSSLIGDDLLAFLLMFIYKPPGVEQSVHPFHQDAIYFPFGPQRQCCGVWIPLDPVSEANGSLSVVPGSHRFEIHAHAPKAGINRGALAATAEDNDEFHARAVTLELAPGDCLLFSTRLLHRSGGNRTTGHRRVITLHMASARCKSRGDYDQGEYAFTSVRGRTYPGCLQPVEAPALTMARARI